MNILAIIAEYNPFHNGHLYHLQKSISITKADYSIAIISGNFCERGNTSIVDKWVKAKMALSSGIDLAIELPFIYSTSSAENFADGAIKILNSLKFVNYLSFGAETDDISILQDIANLLANPTEKFKLNLKSELSTGISFPKARENAVLKYFNNNHKYLNILSSPNNILAIEYLKSMIKLNSKITPILVKRTGCDYNSLSICSNFASSSAIRNLLINNDISNVENLMPHNSYEILKKSFEDGNYVSDLFCFNQTILYLLRKMKISEIANLPDVSEGLENLLKSASYTSNSYIELINSVKSKRYTYTRIQRILLYLLLGITKKDMEISKKIVPYIRILGFNSKGKELLSKISLKNPNVITSVKKFLSTNTNSNFDLLLQKDILSTNIYTLGYKNEHIANLDFTTPIINIP